MTDPYETDDELAALLALDALEPGEQADAELRVGTFAADFAEVSAELASAVADPPPDALRADLFDRALQRRPMGGGIDGVVPSEPLDAFIATVDALAALLATLSDDDFEQPVRAPFGRVRDVVAHLAGVETLMLGWLGIQPIADAALALDHIAITQPVMDELAQLAPSVVATEWRARAARATDAVRTVEPDRALQVHDIPTSRDGMLLLRTFEVWAHHEDIARALDLPLPGLDAARGRLMSSRLADALPLAIALTNPQAPAGSVRLVLTGDGGGTYDLDLGDAAASDALVVTDTVELCRVAADRVQPDQLDAVIEGDRELAFAVLGAASAFSRD